jgi:hypothetical protein
MTINEDKSLALKKILTKVGEEKLTKAIVARTPH